MANLRFVIRHADIGHKFVGREFLSSPLTFVPFSFASVYSTREEAAAVARVFPFATVVDLDEVR
jgi:hypothetical protein